MKIITRFAPSPTGFLHIGGARTALFNYLYAKNQKGKFLLRIEDTDIERSSKEAVDVILNGLKWLEINHDDTICYQLQNQEIHYKLANDLLSKNLAYKCYCTKEDLDKRREEAENKNQTFLYDGRCSHIIDHEPYNNLPYTLRLKVNKSGYTKINDAVLGEIVVENKTIDDFVILRSNKVATYMFAVVCDDHNMGITNVIRGDDHLTNTFKQYQIYKAFNWDVPKFAHIPLIHSEDGKKMSKRKGAVAIDEYKNMGFLPEAIRNYLLRLGWSHQNDEIISDQNAIKWFDIKDINKSPARFDLAKLNHINHHYIKESDTKRLVELTLPFIDQILGSRKKHDNYQDYLLNGISDIKMRSKTLLEVAENSMMYVLKPPFILEEKALALLKNNKDIILQQITLLKNTDDYSRENLHQIIKDHASNNNIKLGDAVSGLRVLLSGKLVSPASIFDIMKTLGKEETMNRITISY